MKQTRKTYGRTRSPSLVTLGLVDAGEIIGTLCSSAIGAIASERRDATSPMRIEAWSFTTSRVAATAASSGFPWLSYVLSSIRLPLTPPFALASSMASFSPLSVESPNVASAPVREPTWPSTITSPTVVTGGAPAACGAWGARFFSQATRERAAAKSASARVGRIRASFGESSTPISYHVDRAPYCRYRPP